ncbi:MAG TPA: hypothetical protein VN693_02680 [Rhodanobacteraceae bacterium]|nr:hypothetical protein [Rhodanobacteraceae bacterium]
MPHFPLPARPNVRTRTSPLVLGCLVAALVITALVYAPGLTGGFVFDDFPNIVDNAGVHVTHSTLANWANAAWSSPSSEFKRPLASLTFALNWFFSGGNPGPMKATNLGIHLLNGVLLFFMLRELLRAWRARRGEDAIDEIAAQRLALAVTAGWLLLPINLMGVLYVVQRMESLCQVFVLAGLWAYLRGRHRMLAAADVRGERKGFALSTAGLILGTGLGLLSKESAVLLPVYAFLAEWTVLGFRTRQGRVDRRVVALFVCVLLLPAVLGLAWLLPRTITPAAWEGRDFTLPERLLTEARILVAYLCWTIFPDPGTLSVYHDQIRLSTGWLAPWTTLASTVFLAGLILLAIALRRRFPLVALGILWFFAGQLLTATFLPLELVYEHRNYFASIGVLLAVFSLLLGLRHEIALPILRSALVLILLVWFGGVTFLRAQDWSNPLKLALAEANRHPDSPRANYEAGRLLIIASDYAPGDTLEASKVYLRRAAALPGSSTLPDQALIMIVDHNVHGDDAALWRSMAAKLRSQPTRQEDISALVSLTQCRTKGDCHFVAASLQQAYLAVLSRPNPIARLLGAYSDFARDLLDDRSTAIRYMRMAVAKDPRETAYRVQLAYLLAQDGQTAEAKQQIQILRRMNNLDRLDAQIATLEHDVAKNAPTTTH